MTFRTDAAPAAIESMAGDGRITVGAGTVINARQVDEAVSAGASFVVSPGLSREVVDRCRHHAIPVLPGAITPTEIMAGIDMGLDTFKFFPAGTFGGAATIAFAGRPFPAPTFRPHRWGQAAQPRRFPLPRQYSCRRRYLAHPG